MDVRLLIVCSCMATIYLIECIDVDIQENDLEYIQYEGYEDILDEDLEGILKDYREVWPENVLEYIQYEGYEDILDEDLEGILKDYREVWPDMDIQENDLEYIQYEGSEDILYEDSEGNLKDYREVRPDGDIQEKDLEYIQNEVSEDILDENSEGNLKDYREIRPDGDIQEKALENIQNKGSEDILDEDSEGILKDYREIRPDLTNSSRNETQKYDDYGLVICFLWCPAPKPKAVHGAWGSWNGWSSCSRTCGSGTKHRTRSCNNPSPSHGGHSCNGNSDDDSGCNMLVCVVNGAWGGWSTWSPCSKTCGSGRRQRTRSCNNPRPSNGGTECIGRSPGFEQCNTKECIIDGEWGGWGEWSACSQTSGIVKRQRSRSCDSPRPSGGGSICWGDSSESNTNNCSVNGGWSYWREWSACSKSCRRRRKRRCNNPKPASGGSRCMGQRIDREQCNTNECDHGHSHGHRHEHGHGHLHGHVHGHGSYEYIAVDGAWGSWNGWSSCSRTCGSGMKHRTRSCNSPRPSHGGHSCNGHSDDDSGCNMQVCGYGHSHGHGHGHGHWHGVGDEHSHYIDHGVNYNSDTSERYED